MERDYRKLVTRVGAVMARVQMLAARYNIAPTQLAPVIYRESGQTAMKLMRWGLIPSWAKDASVGNANVNARSETLASRNAFREPYQRRRCLIPADGFYEWQEREGKRQPFRITLKSGEPFCFAGLWDRWQPPPSQTGAEPNTAAPDEPIDSFTIITRAANAAIAPLHDRMPVIIAKEHYGDWLGSDEPQRGLPQHALDQPLDEPLRIYPVSPLMNSPKVDDARCIAPVPLERDMFERQWWDDG